MRRPAPLSKPPRLETAVVSLKLIKFGDGGVPVLGEDKESLCLIVRADVVVDMTDLDRSGALGRPKSDGCDVLSLRQGAPSGVLALETISRGVSTGLTVTLCANGCSPSLDAFKAENIDSSPRRLCLRASWLIVLLDELGDGALDPDAEGAIGRVADDARPERPLMSPPIVFLTPERMRSTSFTGTTASLSSWLET